MKDDFWVTIDVSRLHQDVHRIDLDSLFQRFHSNQCTGLASEFALTARVHYGSNRILPPRLPGYVWLLAKQLLMGFNTFLWLAGVLAIIAYKPLGAEKPSITNLGLGVVIFLVIICNAILNVYQKMKSIKIVASFPKLLPTLATVRRDGVEQQMNADGIVPGDIILVRAGDKLPADCRFLTCHGLKINTSEMTGESKLIVATVHCSSETFMESTNIGFYCSFVEQGSGEAIVIATGDNTVLGQMSRVTQEAFDDETTGLHREVNRFLLLVVLAATICILLLWITWLVWLRHAYPTFVPVTKNILNSVNIIVSFLPFNLASAITIVLTIVARRLYQQRVITNSLQIVEKFNSVSVIATDKTGTLTENKMVVISILWDTDGEYRIVANHGEKAVKNMAMSQAVRPLSATAKVTPAAETSSSSAQSKVNIEVFDELLLGAALCNDAERHLVHDARHDQHISNINSELRVIGDSVDVALYNLCVYQRHMDIDEVRCLNPRLKVLPFNSTNRLMITANRLEPHARSSLDRQCTVLITLKGAPENVLQRCSTYKTDDNQILPLTGEVKEKLLHRQERLGRNGYCLIAMCQRKFTQTAYDHIMQQHDARRRFRTSRDEDLHGFPTSSYCFLGLFALFDPPRADAPDAVLQIRRAHIRVAMITGDHPTTAQTIGKQVNILSSDVSSKNGLDTFKIEVSARGQSVVQLYRNEVLLSPYAPTSRAIIIDESDRLIELPWFKRWYSACRNQIHESKAIFQQEAEKEKIPYAVVVTGSQIDYLDEFLWNWVLSHQELIFARMSPEQKLRIIKEFQRRGETVAVIGDGTNDAPSLKCADLGVAMQSGANVSKDASDMILLDDRFSSIVLTIETGRLLKDNLKKVTLFLLPAGTWAQLWPVIFNIWLGIPLPLSAFLAIVFCMLNDMIISLAMVRETAETDLMSRPPAIRNKSHLVDLKLLLHAYPLAGNIACFTAFFSYAYYWTDNGVPLHSFMFTYDDFGVQPPLAYSSEQLSQMTNVAQSIYYIALCIFQIFNFFATRTRYASIFQHNPVWGRGRNLYGLGAIAISIGVQLILTQVAWFNQLFDTAPVPFKYVMPAVGFGVLWLLLDELRKLCIRQFSHSFIAKLAW